MNLVIYSECVLYAAGLSNSEDTIHIQNKSPQPVAYKVRVNQKNMFTLPDPGGIILAGEHKALPVILKASSEYRTVESIPPAKFLLELVAADDGYHLLGQKAFWESKSSADIVNKRISADFQVMG